MNAPGCSHIRAHVIYSSTIKGSICSASSKCHGNLAHLCHTRNAFGGTDSLQGLPERCQAINQLPSKNIPRLDMPENLKKQIQRPIYGIGYYLDPDVSGSFTVEVTGK